MDETLKRKYDEKISELLRQNSQLRAIARGRADRLRYLETEVRRMVADRTYVVPS